MVFPLWKWPYTFIHFYMLMQNKSQKEIILEEKIQKLVADIVEHSDIDDNLPVRMMKQLLENEEIKAIQDYANTVSITRLGLNDHGPVHMRTVCHNALKMLSILHDAGVETSLQKEHSGSFADSVVAVMIAARTIIRSMAMEGILGHMATHSIHSIEAGLILIADGCDMTKGRARIALEIPTKPTEGDIHKYSANSIEKVRITRGIEHPIKIEVLMKSEVGLFQVEGVLMPKIQSSPSKHLVELYACVEGQETKRYL